MNGVTGSWREAVINPDILLLFVNPLLLLGGYGLLIYFFRCYMGSKKAVISKVFAVTIFALATVVVVLGVFWKAFTT